MQPKGYNGQMQIKFNSAIMKIRRKQLKLFLLEIYKSSRKASCNQEYHGLYMSPE